MEVVDIGPTQYDFIACLYFGEYKVLYLIGMPALKVEGISKSVTLVSVDKCWTLPSTFLSPPLLNVTGFRTHTHFFYKNPNSRRPLIFELLRIVALRVASLFLDLAAYLVPYKFNEVQ